MDTRSLPPLPPFGKLEKTFSCELSDLWHAKFDRLRHVIACRAKRRRLCVCACHAGSVNIYIYIASVRYS